MARHYSKPKAKPEHYRALSKVITLECAAELVYRHPNQIKSAIDSGRIAAIKCRRNWLVSLDSLLEAFPNEKRASRQ
jgi:hypothetical protein